MKTLAALIVALAATGVQAKEVFTIENPAQCAKAHEMLNVDASFKQVDIKGQRFYIKDKHVGHFSKPCTETGQGELYTESFEEFKQRYAGINLTKEDVVLVNDSAKAAVKTVEADESFCSSTFCKVAVGAVVVAALIYGIRQLGPASIGCMVPSDIAKDGSRCGGRAASVRPGGK
jgi:hypothetical protein